MKFSVHRIGIWTIALGLYAACSSKDMIFNRSGDSQNYNNEVIWSDQDALIGEILNGDGSKNDSGIGAPTATHRN